MGFTRRSGAGEQAEGRVDSDGLRHMRHGTCHRCGWAGPVGTLARHDRRHLSNVAQYRRLCADCAIDLRKATEGPRTAPQHQNSDLRLMPTHRDVA